MHGHMPVLLTFVRYSAGRTTEILSQYEHCLNRIVDGYLPNGIELTALLTCFESGLWAAKRYQVCRHKISGMPPQYIGCVATRYQVCRHKISGVSLQDIRCAATRYRVCRHKISGVPPQDTRCVDTRFQACRWFLQEIV
jgi:hypothetical protein